MILNWTKEQARQFVVNYQLINTFTNPTIKDVFDRIKMIQMDPLNVVGINPELVLQSRIESFVKEDLQAALYQDRYLIDGWDRQQSIYQSQYFRHYKLIRLMHASRLIESTKKRLNIDIKQYFEEILNTLKEQGPLLSSQIKIGQAIHTQGVQIKPSRIALDVLFHQGKIGVSSRRGPQKKYDLMSHLLIHNGEDPFQTEEAFIEWYLYRRIQVCGLAWAKSSIQFQGYYIDKKTIRNKYIKVLLEKEMIVEVKIEGIEDVFYVPKKALDIPLSLEDRISFIAPLDNLIWDRQLLKVLFDFDYLWEVYVPKNKRKYGYYVLPILRGSSFIGRIEFEKHRNNQALKILSLQFEDHIHKSKTLDLKLKQALDRFGKYLGTKTIAY